MKKVLKIIVFIIILVFLWIHFFHILWLPKTSINYFFEEPKNSLDVVYVGSSNAYAHFNTILAYHKYGFTTGLLSTDSQNPIMIEYLLKESQKYQSPRLYVIDVAKVIDNFDIFSEGDLRKSIDSMPFSLNRIEAIHNILKYYDYKDYLNYYFSFFKYHNVWKSISKSNYDNSENLYKGFLFSSFTAQIKSQNSYTWNNDEESLPLENLEVLNNLLDYIKTENLNCIFVIPRRAFDNQSIRRLNYLIKILQEWKFQIINFNNIENLMIDNDDFYNSAHLNIYGATKYTLYFSKYLNENYDLPDHRNDKKYLSWDKEYDRFKTDFEKLTKQNFDDLLKEDRSD